MVPGAHLEAIDAARSMREHSRAHRTGSESLMQSSSRTHVNTCRWGSQTVRQAGPRSYRSAGSVAGLSSRASHGGGSGAGWAPRALEQQGSQGDTRACSGDVRVNVEQEGRNCIMTGTLVEWQTCTRLLCWRAPDDAA